MVLIQHALTQLYLQSYAEWTTDAHEAWMFQSEAEAIRFCQMGGLRDVQLLIPTETDVIRVDVPVSNVSFHYRDNQSVPVILPSADLRPN